MATRVEAELLVEEAKDAQVQLKLSRVRGNANDAFLAAAKACIASGLLEEAAACVYNAGCFQDAGELFEWCGSKVRSGSGDISGDADRLCALAVKCFERVGRHTRAGHTRAASCLEQAGRDDDAVAYLKRHKLYPDALEMLKRRPSPRQNHREVADLTKLAAAQLLHHNEIDRARKILSHLTVDEQLTFLAQHNGSFEDVLMVLDKEGRFEDAARRCSERGKHADAARYLEKALDRRTKSKKENSPTAIETELAKAHLQNARQVLLRPGPLDAGAPQLRSELDKARGIFDRTHSRGESRELNECMAILSGDAQPLFDAAVAYGTRQPCASAGAFFAWQKMETGRREYADFDRIAGVASDLVWIGLALIDESKVNRSTLRRIEQTLDFPNKPREHVLHSFDLALQLGDPSTLQVSSKNVRAGRMLKQLNLKPKQSSNDQGLSSVQTKVTITRLGLWCSARAAFLCASQLKRLEPSGMAGGDTLLSRLKFGACELIGTRDVFSILYAHRKKLESMLNQNSAADDEEMTALRNVSQVSQLPQIVERLWSLLYPEPEERCTPGWSAAVSAFLDIRRPSIDGVKNSIYQQLIQTKRRQKRLLSLWSLHSILPIRIGLKIQKFEDETIRPCGTDDGKDFCQFLRCLHGLSRDCNVNDDLLQAARCLGRIVGRGLRLPVVECHDLLGFHSTLLLSIGAILGDEQARANIPVLLPKSHVACYLENPLDRHGAQKVSARTDAAAAMRIDSEWTRRRILLRKLVDELWGNLRASAEREDITYSNPKSCLTVALVWAANAPRLHHLMLDTSAEEDGAPVDGIVFFALQLLGKLQDMDDVTIACNTLSTSANAHLGLVTLLRSTSDSLIERQCGKQALAHVSNEIGQLPSIPPRASISLVIAPSEVIVVQPDDEVVDDGNDRERAAVDKQRQVGAATHIQRIARGNAARLMMNAIGQQQQTEAPTTQDQHSTDYWFEAGIHEYSDQRQNLPWFKHHCLICGTQMDESHKAEPSHVAASAHFKQMKELTRDFCKALATFDTRTSCVDWSSCEDATARQSYEELRQFRRQCWAELQRIKEFCAWTQDEDGWNVAQGQFREFVEQLQKQADEFILPTPDAVIAQPVTASKYPSVIAEEELKITLDDAADDEAEQIEIHLGKGSGGGGRGGRRRGAKGSGATGGGSGDGKEGGGSGKARRSRQRGTATREATGAATAKKGHQRGGKKRGAGQGGSGGSGGGSGEGGGSGGGGSSGGGGGGGVGSGGAGGGARGYSGS